MNSTTTQPPFRPGQRVTARYWNISAVVVSCGPAENGVGEPYFWTVVRDEKGEWGADSRDLAAAA